MIPILEVTDDPNAMLELQDTLAGNCSTGMMAVNSHVLICEVTTCARAFFR